MSKVRISLCAAIVLFSFNVFAQSTTIQTVDIVSDENIDKAIATLRAAKSTSTDADRNAKIIAAKNLLVNGVGNVTYKASVEVNGQRQFDGEDFYGMPDFENTCFRGTAQEASRLISAALNLENWNSDEEWITSVVVSGRNINIVVHDGPNEVDLEYSIAPCK